MSMQASSQQVVSQVKALSRAPLYALALGALVASCLYTSTVRAEENAVAQPKASADVVVNKCVTNVPEGYKGKVYEIGTDLSFAPFSFIDNDGLLKGIDVEIFAEVAKAEGIKYRMCADIFDPMLHSVVDGELDGAIAGISYTVNRSKILDYSKRYYNSAVAIVTMDTKRNIIGYEEIKHKTVAVKKGTLGEEMVTNVKDEMDFTINSFPNTMECMMSVHMGESDFMVEDYPVAVYQLNTGLYPGLVVAVSRIPDISNNESYHFVVPKGKNAQLMNSFNQGLDKIINSGAYKKIIDEYLPNSPASPFVTKERPDLILPQNKGKVESQG